jgi:hypothetical protein
MKVNCGGSSENVYLRPGRLDPAPTAKTRLQLESRSSGIPAAIGIFREVTGPVAFTAKDQQGLTLLETLIAVLILSCGLLAAGQLIYVALGSTSLSRSKSGAVLAAQHKLEYLADLYRRNTRSPDLSDGSHGPEEVQIVNPVQNTILNRFAISWTVGEVRDPRPGRILPAKAVTVAVTPIDAAGAVNTKTYLNKDVRLTTIFSSITP